MVGQSRAPGVQHGGQADARAQMLGIGGDGDEGLGGGPEQEVVDGGLVLEPDRADRRRQGEDDVIVGNLQKLGLALGQPLSGRRPLTFGAVAFGSQTAGRSPAEPVSVRCESGGSVKIPCKQAIYQGILQNLDETRTLMRYQAIGLER